MATHTILAPGTRPEATGRTRREAFTALGVTALAGVAAVGFAWPEGIVRPGDAKTSPDVALVALCAQFDDLERQMDATFDLGLSEDDADSLREPLQEAQAPLFEQILAIRATTLEGHQARARTFHLWDKELANEGAEGAGWSERMSWALVRDLVGEG